MILWASMPVPLVCWSRKQKLSPILVVTITKNGTTVKAGQLMKLMSLGVKQGDVVTVAAEGANEDAAIAALTAFFNNNL